MDTRNKYKKQVQETDMRISFQTSKWFQKHRFCKFLMIPVQKSAIAKKRRIQYDTDRDFFPLVAEYIYYVLLYLLTLNVIWVMAIENRSIVELNFASRFWKSRWIKQLIISITMRTNLPKLLDLLIFCIYSLNFSLAFFIMIFL